jgi:hypothetical protein
MPGQHHEQATIAPWSSGHSPAKGQPAVRACPRRKFVRTATCYRAIEIQVGAHAITAAEPLPDDARETLDRIHRHTGALFERTRAPAERSSVVFVVPGF